MASGCNGYWNTQVIDSAFVKRKLQKWQGCYQAPKFKLGLDVYLCEQNEIVSNRVVGWTLFILDEKKNFKKYQKAIDYIVEKLKEKQYLELLKCKTLGIKIKPKLLQEYPQLRDKERLDINKIELEAFWNLVQMQNIGYFNSKASDYSQKVSASQKTDIKKAIEAFLDRDRDVLRKIFEKYSFVDISPVCPSARKKCRAKDRVAREIYYSTNQMLNFLKSGKDEILIIIKGLEISLEVASEKEKNEIQVIIEGLKIASSYA